MKKVNDKSWAEAWNDNVFSFNNPTRPRAGVTCLDGFTISVQASSKHYCTPKVNQMPSKNTVLYTEVECAFPSQKEELLMPYCDDPDKPTNSVYDHVPAVIIYKVLQKHGGMISGHLPPLDLDNESTDYCTFNFSDRVKYNSDTSIALIWHINDVQKALNNMKDNCLFTQRFENNENLKLTDEECLMILHDVEDDHDAGLGVTFDTLESAVVRYFEGKYL